MTVMFDIKNLQKSFGGVAAVNDVSFQINEGELFGVIGPNGAGKTTLFNLITGFSNADSGEILYYGKDIIGKKTHQLVQSGIVRTFQSTNLFLGNTVLENIMMGGFLSYRPSILRNIFTNTKLREKELLIYAEEISDFVGISKYNDTIVDNLPYGYKRLVGIAIALACKPKVLLLDEPAAGMVEEETKELVKIIKKVHQTGVTVVLIEHDMKMVMNLCEKITVLEFGKKISYGIPEEVSQDKEVIRAYLGVES
ncbi:ABC transporter ATP-binding protein [Oceanobacillus salinisoli]|uniref:ABC transporter ATP-binding protein n=1 Tax=Oceanobacillus salinisoli TaxID=2678611 RepID=UPI0018CC3E1F|nr:ABC transporter ATP-binding protein [Oceanobacillus salinisoli]